MDRTPTARDRREVRIILYIAFGAMLGLVMAFSPVNHEPKCATGRIASAWTENRSTLLNFRNQGIQNAAHSSDATERVPLLIEERTLMMRRVDSTFRVRMDVALQADAATGCR